MNALKQTALTVIVAASAAAMTSCFTGIESTPAITGRDVVRRGADSVSVPGDSTDISSRGEPPAQWSAGKLFYVTDRRAGLLFKAPAEQLPQAGDTLALIALQGTRSITGDSVTDIIFRRLGSDGHQLTYRINVSPSAMMTRQRIEVPYTVELSVVDRQRQQMLGHTYYILSATWCDAAGEPVTTGRKMVPVRVIDVVAGTENNPVRVIFDSDGAIHSVFMQPGQTSLDRMFSTTDPRLRYPDITDEMWSRITHGQVAEGMTRQECGLALGQPDDVERGYGYSSVHERWTYRSGAYLIFTDGLLTQTNIR